MHFLVSDADLDRWLDEDAPYGDLTTHLLGIGDRPARITFRTRTETVIGGVQEAARVLERVGCVVERRVAAGARLSPGDVILQARGEAGLLHLGWKVGLNLIEWCSGVATATNRLVQAARSEQPGVVVAATRKVFPGTKRLALGAVLAGGGVPHRLGLSDSVLVFPQHIAMLGGLDVLLARLDALRAGLPGRKLAVEVHTAEDALRVAAVGVDILQIDKLTPEELVPLVSRLREVAPTMLVAAAGGINQTNVVAYANTEVAILVTSAMYAARPADVGVVIEPC